jgi:MoaA/NifB/PqqE/SkfB family radical SAM enzyme
LPNPSYVAYRRRLADRLALVRDRGVPLGLVFTLTMWNAHQIEWAVDYALANGAQLLQVHPLEASGRAAGLIDDVPEEIEAGMALLECLRLQKSVADRLAIQADIAISSQLHQMTCQSDRRPERISDVVSPLVVEPDGICVPLEYGFLRNYALGNVHHASLCDLADDWMKRLLPSFVAGMALMNENLANGGERIVVNSYSMVRQTLSSAEA